MATIYQVPNQEINEFSELFHHASFAGAWKILNSQKVYGTDPDRHANFFASRKFKNKDLSLPASTDVCLEFEWLGSQLVLDCMPAFGEPKNTGMTNPTLYHIIGKNPANINQWAIGDHLYWQSIIYPGSNHLKLKSWSYSKYFLIPRNESSWIDRVMKREPKLSEAQIQVANFENLADQLRQQGVLFKTSKN